MNVTEIGILTVLFVILGFASLRTPPRAAAVLLIVGVVAWLAAGVLLLTTELTWLFATLATLGGLGVVSGAPGLYRARRAKR